MGLIISHQFAGRDAIYRVLLPGIGTSPGFSRSSLKMWRKVVHKNWSRFRVPGCEKESSNSGNIWINQQPLGANLNQPSFCFHRRIFSMFRRLFVLLCFQNSRADVSKIEIWKISEATLDHLEGQIY